MRKLIIDLDGVVFDTIRTITDIYNIDHAFYKDFKVVSPEEVKSWEFTELDLEPPEYIDRYFCQPRFFEHLTLMKSCVWIINKLKDDYKIIFCSSGLYPNLQLKRIWLKNHFPMTEFIPIELPTYKDKSEVDMSGDTIFIDDCSNNLKTSNAKIKICFGEVYEWNKDWNGIRCKDWKELFGFLMNLKEKERSED